MHENSLALLSTMKFLQLVSLGVVHSTQAVCPSFAMRLSLQVLHSPLETYCFAPLQTHVLPETEYPFLQLVSPHVPSVHENSLALVSSMKWLQFVVLDEVHSTHLDMVLLGIKFSKQL